MIVLPTILKIAANELHPGLTAESGLMWQAFGADDP